MNGSEAILLSDHNKGVLRGTDVFVRWGGVTRRWRGTRRPRGSQRTRGTLSESYQGGGLTSGWIARRCARATPRARSARAAAGGAPQLRRRRRWRWARPPPWAAPRTA
eukprot:657303-Prorocentrum_minimum.AAC.2